MGKGWFVKKDFLFCYLDHFRISQIHTASLHDACVTLYFLAQSCDWYINNTVISLMPKHYIHISVFIFNSVKVLHPENHWIKNFLYGQGDQADSDHHVSK